MTSLASSCAGTPTTTAAWDTEFVHAETTAVQMLKSDEAVVQHARVAALNSDGNLSGDSAFVVDAETAPPLRMVAPALEAQDFASGGGAPGCRISSSDDTLALGTPVFLALGGAIRRRRADGTNEKDGQR